MYSFLRCSFLFFRAKLEVKSGSRQKGVRSGANKSEMLAERIWRHLKMKKRREKWNTRVMEK